MTIRFANGKTVKYIDALETEEYYNGSNRRTLTFECLSDAVGIDELNNILSDEQNLREIVLQDDETTTQSICSGYVLKIRLSIEKKMIEPQTPDNEAQYDDRIIFKIAKRTYIEEQLRKMNI